MHEYSIAQAMVELACREAQQAGATRVTRVVCRVGVLRQIEDPILREAFELAGQGTLCEHAVLEIEKTELKAACPACHRQFTVVAWDWTCPRCSQRGTALPGGDELEMVSLEAEEAA
jgi:hydrogenase nickel insertion protein HypA